VFRTFELCIRGTCSVEDFIEVAWQNLWKVSVSGSLTIGTYMLLYYYMGTFTI
jgi:hypothetical protein